MRHGHEGLHLITNSTLTAIGIKTDLYDVSCILDEALSNHFGKGIVVESGAKFSDKKFAQFIIESSNMVSLLMAHRDPKLFRL